MLKPLDSDLFVAEAPLRFGGVEVGARMTVVRLPDSKLFLHSPIAATPELVEEVRALGAVTWLIAPNRFHHLFVGDWKSVCPEAAIHAAPGLDAKRPDLEIESVLGDEPEPGWADSIDQVVLAGLPMMNEVVFFHRASASLILSDLAFNVGPGSPWLTRVAFALIGSGGRLGPTFLERVLVRDRVAFRRSLERVLAWPFERVVVAHGRVCEQGGRGELARGYAWALAGSTTA